jgi:hypothetical protein
MAAEVPVRIPQRPQPTTQRVGILGAHGRQAAVPLDRLDQYGDRVFRPADTLEREPDPPDRPGEIGLGGQVTRSAASR